MKNLQQFIKFLESKDDLKRIQQPVSTFLEITEIHRRTLEADGPALLFENVFLKDGTKSDMPVLTNLFGSRRRILWGMGTDDEGYRKLAANLALLRFPRPPASLKDAWPYLPLLKKLLAMRPRVMESAQVHRNIYLGEQVNLHKLPIQWCWPSEPAPLITWGKVITKPSKSARQTSSEDYNTGVYRLQVLGKNKLIMRWLRHRGGAQHFRAWQQKYPGEDMPVAIVIGADPALILAAVMPLPENMSELKFAGLLRNDKTDLIKARTVDLMVPANAEIIIEGYVSAKETALEGPYGDHTGYYNAAEPFPVVNVTAVTTVKNPVYLSTYTGRPLDEPAVLSLTLNDLFTPLLKAQMPEVEDFYLLPEACSYRTAVVAIKKSYPGQAKKVAMGVWSSLNQFMYTKLIIVIDADLNARSHDDVNWAISTNVDPVRDVTIIKDTPMDYLDFASQVEHLSSKMMVDATTKILPETNRVWGQKLHMDAKTIERVDKMWASLDILKK